MCNNIQLWFTVIGSATRTAGFRGRSSEWIAGSQFANESSDLLLLDITQKRDNCRDSRTGERIEDFYIVPVIRGMLQPEIRLAPRLPSKWKIILANREFSKQRRKLRVAWSLRYNYTKSFEELKICSGKLLREFEFMFKNACVTCSITFLFLFCEKYQNYSEQKSFDLSYSDILLFKKYIHITRHTL